MTSMTLAEFTAQAQAEGYDQVLVREWEPNLQLDTHTHPFGASVLVIRGSYSFTVGEQVRQLKPGDTFKLAKDVPHAEHYGPEGATIWVARAN
ncbi:MAG: AraC family transcriptional regulator [Betaproteobacteria bacterium]|jgi:quercetin dioxygenase-like cupin family protein|nr:AraC family transcriptional regulator [Betaproteobacteria bacterium]